jgi:hypothetical protein
VGEGRIGVWRSARGGRVGLLPTGAGRGAVLVVGVGRCSGPTVSVTTGPGLPVPPEPAGSDGGLPDGAGDAWNQDDPRSALSPTMIANSTSAATVSVWPGVLFVQAGAARRGPGGGLSGSRWGSLCRATLLRLHIGRW